MPVGEERLVKPISLSDGTLLFMYYKYPLRHAFGGVLAEPIVVRHEGGEYRVRYQARDGEGRDRLEGARPIVTRDWVRSKWLNEYLVGLDELRLMASLGGRGGPERELYAILSEPTYRDRLACYASKFPDESGSRLIVLNWVGPLAQRAGAGVKPAAEGSTSSRSVSPRAPVVNVERAPARPPGIEPPSGELPSPVVPLAHQVSPAPPSRSPEPPRDETVRRAAPRAGVEPDVAHRAPRPSKDEEAGTRKFKLGLDSTQPVQIQSSVAPPPAGSRAGQRPTAGRPAVSPVNDAQEAPPRTRVEPPPADLPSRVVPLAHQRTPPAPTPAAETNRETATPPSIDKPPSIAPPAPGDARTSTEPQPTPIDRQLPIEPPPPIASPSMTPSLPIDPASSTGGRRSDEPVGVPYRSSADNHAQNIGRQTAAGLPGSNKSSSLPPLWMIAGVSLFGFCLLIAGWWLRGASGPSNVALSPPGTPAMRAAGATTGAAEPRSDTDRDEDPEPGSPDREEVEKKSPVAGAAVSGVAPEGVRPNGTAAPGNTPIDRVTAAEATPDRVTQDVNRTGATSGAGAAEAPPPERPRQEATGAGEVSSRSAPAASPKPQAPPPAPVAIDTPLLAQGGAVASSPPPAEVQSWEGEVPDEPPAGSKEVVRKPPVSVDAVAPRPAPAPVEQGVPTLKLTAAQISGAQRNYLARVIRFLEPPLKYEWTPKYMRPGFFVSLVTDGEPPECRIDFKEPTAITFDLVIRGGGGTESRIEDVELLYR